MKRIVLLGATGSIGRQAIEAAKNRLDEVCIVGMSAHSGETELVELAIELGHPALCLSGRAPKDDRILYSGQDGIAKLIIDCEPDIVLNAIAGADGFMPSILAARSGALLALANKESMVMGGRFVFEEAKRSGATILPVDSEHFALFTLIAALGNDKISELVLTASGGAFRDAPLESLHRKTFRDALAHPTWNMGPKITVDSATMANKGLEVIEAVRLFDANPDMVKVSIHKQSKVHALVRATDGCFFAHVSGPDMRLPIDASFAWPSQPKPYGALALEELGELTFEKPDTHRYPMLPLAYRSLEAGESHCIAYNASNEIAVAEFSAGRIGFTDIVRVVERTLSRDLPTAPDSFDDVIHIDSAVRRLARIEADSIIYDKGGTH